MCLFAILFYIFIGGAKLLQSGVVGQGTNIETYNTTLGDQYQNIRATIERDSCLPVHLVYIDSDYGSVTSCDVYGITPGIKDTKIFDIPPQCKHVSPIYRKNQVCQIFTHIRIYLC